MTKHERGQNPDILKVTGNFPSEADAERWFIEQRWTEGVRCPSCRAVHAHERATAKRSWRCRDCHKDFSTKTGTLMQGSNLGFGKWALAVYLLSTSQTDISCANLASALGVSQITAWHLAMRIRETYTDRESPPGACTGGDMEGNGESGTKASGVRNAPAANRDASADGMGGDNMTEATDFIAQGSLHGYSTRRRIENTSIAGHEQTVYIGALHENGGTGDNAKDTASTSGLGALVALLMEVCGGTHHWMNNKHTSRYVAAFAGERGGRSRHVIDRMVNGVEGGRFTERESTT